MKKRKTMTSQQFGATYLQYEADIIAILNSKRVFDEDLLHDTYIALFEHSQHPEPGDFVKTFVTFYTARCKRRDEHERHYECCDHTQLLNYDRPDKTDLPYREQVGKRIDKLVRYFCEHPQPGVRNHRRACKILRLHLQGLNECEISHKLKISQSAVHQQLDSIIARLKLIAKW